MGRSSGVLLAASVACHLFCPWLAQDWRLAVFGVLVVIGCVAVPVLFWLFTQALHASGVFAVTLVLAAWLLQVRGGLLWSERAAAPLAPDPEERRIVDKLQQALAAERVHQREGLTISALAAHLGVQEYRLRRAINGQLRLSQLQRFPQPAPRPAGLHGGPMTYTVEGKQYLAIAPGGHATLPSRLGGWVTAYALAD